ncbi:uncharacterized protein H6S33_002069 [Morchella sextelata]|jgi:hypothetical protein|uniref:uncharacterized protein n=1 Tax=Morchella sextelata TaxID=1174677 RepID=UPI001D0431D5|nr:uncharacterized protein H6S33_002069 [Morchella sextelata]KAH0608017.1 hypothetical protein H6S33_002069 [Morchella sextelata]
MNSYKQDQWLSYKERSTQRHVYAGFSCGARDPDWDFVDQQVLKELRPESANTGYKLSSSENPMPLLNDNGGMDEDDDYSSYDDDCVYPYHGGRMLQAPAETQVPECELGSSPEGSVVEDEMIDVSGGEERFAPVVVQHDGDDMMMEMELEMHMSAAAAAAAAAPSGGVSKRKRWADDEEENVQQQQQQAPFAAWGAFPQPGAKRVRVRG